MSNIPQTYRRVVLVRRPPGEPAESDFRVEEVPMPEPKHGEVLVKVAYLSLDPYQRGRMRDAASYAAPVGLGEVMTGGIVGEVVKSSSPRFGVGEIVEDRLGWQEYAIGGAPTMRKVDPSLAPISTANGVLGMPGMTAYTGLREIGKPKAGETVVVSAASGAVGSVVGQIARIWGARAVGIAGGLDKCRYVKDELGFDECVDHRASDFPERLKAVCPNGIDVYWENVGGAVFEAVLPLLNFFGRVPVCGLIAQYNATELPARPNRVPQVLRATLTKRLTIRGFIVWDFAHLQDDFLREVAGWISSGRIKYREDIVEGLDSAPQAFIGLLKGRNFGKLLVRVSS